MDNDVDEGGDENAPQGTTVDSLKSSVRETLNALSGSRIRSTKIKFTSGGRHGSGGKAVVVQARFRQWYSIKAELVAVKQLKNVKTERTHREFAHEVGLMAKMSHEHIVKFIGFVEDLENGIAWIVMSWEPNGNISEFLANGSYEIPERVSLIRDTFKGIRYLHTRQPPICHGDLKSLNILVNSSYRAIITDFGSARETRAPESEIMSDGGSQLPTTGQACPPIHVAAAGNRLTLTGPAWSLRWASPEVLNGKRPTLSSDIWAAGWVCWEVMTNTVPFHELNSAGTITLAAINGEVPSPCEDGQLGQIMALCTLMTDCWALIPKSRPSATRCCSLLQWMPAAPPSGGYGSGSKGQSTLILMQKGSLCYEQSDYERAALLVQQALSFAETAGNQKETADALERLGSVYHAQAKLIEAEDASARAKNIYTRIGDVNGRARALKGLGEVYRLQSKYTRAEELYTEAQEVYILIGNQIGLANALRGLGDVNSSQSKYTEAENSLAQAQEIYARLGNEGGQAVTSEALGDVYRRQSRYIEAEQSFDRAQEIYARNGRKRGQANTLYRLGAVYRLQSKYTEAEESYSQAGEIYASIGDDLSQASTFSTIGALRLTQGDNVDAASYYSKARDLYLRIGRTKDADHVPNLLADALPDPKPSITSSQGFVPPNPLSANISP